MISISTNDALGTVVELSLHDTEVADRIAADILDLMMDPEIRSAPAALYAFAVAARAVIGCAHEIAMEKDPRTPLDAVWELLQIFIEHTLGPALSAPDLREQ